MSFSPKKTYIHKNFKLDLYMSTFTESEDCLCFLLKFFCNNQNSCNLVVGHMTKTFLFCKKERCPSFEYEIFSFTDLF